MTAGRNVPTTPGELLRMLTASPAFRALGAPRQAEIRADLAKVFGFLETDPGGGVGDLIQPAPASTPSLVDEIDFPSFVADLIQGVFQAIITSSIEQMEAYSELLSSVAKRIDDFVDHAIDDDAARDHLADKHPDIFRKQITSDGPKLSIVQQAGGAEVMPPLPKLFEGLGFTVASEIDERTLNETIVPQVKRRLARTRHQLLATMVMMGINRIVVREGAIDSKPMFNVDASKTLQNQVADIETTRPD
jgi:hypothetical protein